MPIDLQTDWMRSTSTRLAANVWHEIALCLDRESMHMHELGHTREAAQIAAYSATIGSHAVRHLEKLFSMNGHTKDSTVVTELPSLGLAALEDSTVNGQAPSDVEGAFADGGSHEVGPSPGVPEPVTAVVTSKLEDEISFLIAQLDELMPKKPDHQPYEVALKFCHRARSLARAGQDELARRQMRAANNAMADAKELEIS